MDRVFVVTALVYAIVGMLLGIMMAMSKDHGQLVTHAHVMLVGFVVSFIYALCHKLWLGKNNAHLSLAQCALHQLGAFFMSIGLFLLYGNYVAIEKVDPLLGAASIAVLLAAFLMLVMLVLSFRNAE